MTYFPATKSAVEDTGLLLDMLVQKKKRYRKKKWKREGKTNSNTNKRRINKNKKVWENIQVCTRFLDL
jgi:hypothetical protein